MSIRDTRPSKDDVAVQRQNDARRSYHPSQLQGEAARLPRMDAQRLRADVDDTFDQSL